MKIADLARVEVHGPAAEAREIKGAAGASDAGLVRD